MTLELRADQRVADDEWYMPGLLITVDKRGNGCGHEMLRATIDRFHGDHPPGSLTWVVNQANTEMPSVCQKLEDATTTGTRQLPCGTHVHTYDIWRYG